MLNKNRLQILITMIVLVTYSCNKGPDANGSSPEYIKIEKKSEESSKGSYSPSSMNAGESLSNDLHTVKVNEIITASRYLYLNVSEGEEKFWIAIRKQDIEVGGIYYYKRALLKTDFESKENNKVFEKIYLVTNLVSANHVHEQKSMNDIDTNLEAVIDNKPEVKISENPERNIQQKGSVKISELVQNFKKYEGKTIQISGECVKINPGIMNRNWIHIKDGSLDDYDLVITSDTYVAEGTLITMKALVSLNKDFGAGYTYDLILEDGVLIK
jgi:hypothetical protein